MILTTILSLDFTKITILKGIYYVSKFLSLCHFDERADEDMYASDIQIAELNALAATLSIIRWKKMLGFYADITHEYFSVYGINDNVIENEAEDV